MQDVRITELVAGLDEPFESCPNTGFLGWRQGVRMLPVIAQMRPAGNEYEHVIKAARSQITQLFGALVKADQAVILREVLCIIAIAVGTEIMQDADAGLRSTEQTGDGRSARNLFLQGDELARIHYVTAIAFRHLHIISLLKENHPRRSGIVETCELRDPTRANLGR